MRKWIGTVVVGAAIISSGCATTLCHTGKTAEDFERDKYDCMNISAASANNWGVPGGVIFIHNELQRCMRIKYGYVDCKKGE